MPSIPAHATLRLSDLGCGGAYAVERELSRLPGVSRVYVNPLTEMAYVEFDPSRCTDGEFSAALRRAGVKGAVA